MSGETISDEANNLSFICMRLNNNGSFILKDISIFLSSEKDMVLKVMGFLKGDLLTQDSWLG